MKTLLLFSAFTILSPSALGLEEVATNTLPAPGPDGMITLPGRTRNGGLYTISSFKETFFNALEYCESTGRKFVSIEDPDEQFRISLLLSSNRIADNIWTSGMEMTKGNFIWASTWKKMTYQNIGNTNEYQTDNCLAIVSRGVQRFKWWHYNCENAMNFMCESGSTDNRQTTVSAA